MPQTEPKHHNRSRPDPYIHAYLPRRRRQTCHRRTITHVTTIALTHLHPFCPPSARSHTRLPPPLRIDLRKPQPLDGGASQRMTRKRSSRACSGTQAWRALNDLFVGWTEPFRLQHSLRTYPHNLLFSSIRRRWQIRLLVRMSYMWTASESTGGYEPQWRPLRPLVPFLPDASTTNQRGDAALSYSIRRSCRP
ncbi:hypothetical protein BU24DRAFT_232885 [Aaosphaeria arxii CBS 175.79]|uniref:Uncharacterized protein n=1 Tax=Aaosphaeria arxii CBS 175.79 TaxID=1450172 RepID=A0A6A5XK29_9PLEO|nr:uncharacterized protein BU24DRAFT_232885 [Aaosphaeria arxii CBS 175.79]KAF2013236.1 hypothetical protein BU24DRAFT_232885 [Aaosphaeria arxii CBS 175.79]